MQRAGSKYQLFALRTFHRKPTEQSLEIKPNGVSGRPFTFTDFVPFVKPFVSLVFNTPESRSKVLNTKTTKNEHEGHEECFLYLGAQSGSAESH